MTLMSTSPGHDGPFVATPQTHFDGVDLRALEFASRNDVGAEPCVRHQAEDRQVAVRLHRVADGGVESGQGGLEPGDALANRGGGVGVKWCAQAPGQRVQIHAVECGLGCGYAW